MAVLEATEIELRQEASPEVFHRGEEYFQRGAVEALVRRGDRLEADVRGSDVRPYRRLSRSTRRSFDSRSRRRCGASAGGGTGTTTSMAARPSTRWRGRSSRPRG